jgi:hypothetical protein
MPRFAHDDFYDNGLLHVKNNVDQQVATIGQPATFYEAVYPAVWTNAAYALGDVVRPTGAWNGFVYEVTTAGAGGGAEPAWPTVAGNTVTSGGVTFTARASKLVAAVTMLPADFTISAGDVSGRKVRVGAKTGDTVEVGGNPDHLCLLITGSKRLLYGTVETGSIVFNAGGTVDWGAWDIEIAAPTA